MRILVVAGSAEKRSIIRAEVLEAVQGEGECLTSSHKDGTEICLRKQPDLVVVCDYEEVAPMACAIGLQSFAGIKKLMPEGCVIRMGDRHLGHKDYCNSIMSLKAMVYMLHRERGGPIYKATRR